MSDEFDIELPVPKSRFGDYLRTVCGLVLAVFVYLGGFALWIWALRLLYENWGGFWALMGIFVFPFTLVVVFTCVFWGVWYFLLGFGAWLVSIAAFARLSEHEVSLLSVISTTLLSVALASGCGYYLWLDVSGQGPLVGSRLEAAHDDALAIVAVMQATAGDADAETALSAIKATTSLKKRISKYNDKRTSEIRKTVDLYLQYERAVTVDAANWMSRFTKGEAVEFLPGERTNALYDRLPKRLQLLADRVTAELNTLPELLSEAFDEYEIPENWRELLDARYELIWGRYNEVYETIFGSSLELQEPSAP